MNQGLEKKDFIFVGVQMVLFILYVFDFNLLTINSYYLIGYFGLGTTIIGALIVVIALLQLNTNLSPFPSPKFNTSLIKSGVYKFIRHPIYTGIILASFGYGLYTDSFYKILISIGLYILFYFKSEYEEERLTKKFSDYIVYKKSTGRFFPRFSAP